MRDFFKKFMYGRYGTDSLSGAMYVATIVIFTIGILFQSTVIYALAFAVFVLSLLRSLSKNLPQRRMENAEYIKISGKVKRYIKSRIYRISHAKEYKYLRCPKCHTDLRVPRGKGKITLTCPCCKNRFDGKS
ncbi:MAG: hypothetical protein J5922_04740 [Clostridia bacterium]|nr:hypothetical protein [Clostridia bacterium]